MAKRRLQRAHRIAPTEERNLNKLRPVWLSRIKAHRIVQT